MKKIVLLCCAVFFFSQYVFCQACKVNVDSLKGLYTGNCVNGKAEGTGTATGIDSYAGHFKNGYPDGEGKYIWKNGSWYDGSWKSGVFDGQGTYSKISGAADSAALMTGFWKKGKFLGKFEKPYIAHVLTNNINDLSIRKINSAGSDIVITVKSITGGASSILGGTPLPKVKLTGVQLIEGRFDQQVGDENSSPINNKYTFRKVVFPFYAIFTFEAIGTKLQAERVGIEFYENCNWYVQVNIDN